MYNRSSAHRRQTEYLSGKRGHQTPVDRKVADRVRTRRIDGPTVWDAWGEGPIPGGVVFTRIKRGSGFDQAKHRMTMPLENRWVRRFVFGWVGGCRQATGNALAITVKAGFCIFPLSFFSSHQFMLEFFYITVKPSEGRLSAF
jgi:hypothetical protein